VPRDTRTHVCGLYMLTWPVKIFVWLDARTRILLQVCTHTVESPTNCILVFDARNFYGGGKIIAKMRWQ